MAVASASYGNANENDGDSRNVTVSTETPSYRSLCQHYSRGCSFISPCCGQEYACRLCHDENESHKIDRHSIREIKCRKCSLNQSVANYCCGCGLQFGLYYFCAICNFYDDVNNGQFHCEKCGICRARGKENFFHCDMCGFCLALEKKENHTCRENISRNNCPICMEDIHTSRDPAHVPRCGHVLHSTCFKGLMEKGLYKCPQCQTSLVDMRQHWARLDAEREAWVMPQQLREFKVKIHCRDCGQEGDTYYHMAGFKCSGCGSYNTVRCGSEELPLVPTDFLHRHHQHDRQRGGRPEWRRPRSRRGRHREERALLERKLELMEQRALMAEQKLSDAQQQLHHIEQRAQLQKVVAQQARDSVAIAKERSLMADQRADIAEERAVDLEHRLFEAEAELEELAEYKEVLESFQGFSLQQRQHGSQAELCTDGSGEGSGESEQQKQQKQQKCVLQGLLRHGSLQSYLMTTSASDTLGVAGGEKERRSQCSDQLSITSL